MKNFSKGFFVGTAATVGALIGSVVAFKKTVVAPLEEKEQMIEDNRKRATRKSRSSHHS
ncbi:DUF3042 family protein [Dellaglioa algida]|uniref:DUF3042 family protein n=1 Tax=Dellaglioa algida TaxID=105612 RepID=UPI0024C4A531|nr:DUF3042 family protein [Dellaglioa algida]MDK1726490.1 DUF3042 family protein [Dellaglioa algida]